MVYYGQSTEPERKEIMKTIASFTVNHVFVLVIIYENMICSVGIILFERLSKH